jgi:arginine exporter protein ArgO
MNTGDWMFYYGTRAVEWLNPIVYLVGLGIAVWAFRHCHKWGYLVVAAYFALVVFSLLAMPSI